MNKFLTHSLLLSAVWLGLGSKPSRAQTAVATDTSDLTHWPAGASPQEIGKRVAESFAASPHLNNSRTAPIRRIIYPEVCAWYGALTFAKESGDKALSTKLIQRFEPIFGSEAALVPVPNHVDNNVFGVVPLELYIETKDKRYLDLGQSLADKQWAFPTGNRIPPEAIELYNSGYTPQTRLWVDDMYMINALQTEAYRATGDRKYIDLAAKEMVLYLSKLEMPNGLFYHAPDVPFYWGRGNGWFAAGMAEVLRSLPLDNPRRPRILQSYRTMMASLLKYQAPNGTWRQLVDDPESWSETSSTGMFAFAMITGVKNGWLDRETYGPAARKAWLGLVSYIDENAEIHDVCEGTNKRNNRQYYLDRRRITGDLHGQAPVLWCATALLR